MTDVFSRKQRSQVMAAVRSRGNRATELKLILIFRVNGITGWRRNQRLPGKPDFVFRKERLAVFVDGCFWHGCPKHGELPAANRQYWCLKVDELFNIRK
jgi:DNA mismatch endonuclease (patch repair protein)